MSATTRSRAGAVTRNRDELLHTLLHMLGLDANHRDAWRNHYVTGGTDLEILALVAGGLVEETGPLGFLADGDRSFRATERGRAVAIAENYRRNPPPSPAKARYLRWLNVADCFPDLTFGEWLRRKLYADPAWGGP